MHSYYQKNNDILRATSIWTKGEMLPDTIFISCNNFLTAARHFASEM